MVILNNKCRGRESSSSHLTSAIIVVIFMDSDRHVKSRTWVEICKPLYLWSVDPTSNAEMVGQQCATETSTHAWK